MSLELEMCRFGRGTENGWEVGMGKGWEDDGNGSYDGEKVRVKYDDDDDDDDDGRCSLKKTKKWWYCWEHSCSFSVLELFV